MNLYLGFLQKKVHCSLEWVNSKMLQCMWKKESHKRHISTKAIVEVLE